MIMGALILAGTALAVLKFGICLWVSPDFQWHKMVVLARLPSWKSQRRCWIRGRKPLYQGPQQSILKALVTLLSLSAPWTVWKAVKSALTVQTFPRIILHFDQWGDAFTEKRDFCAIYSLVPSLFRFQVFSSRCSAWCFCAAHWTKIDHLRRAGRRDVTSVLLSSARLPPILLWAGQMARPERTEK